MGPRLQTKIGANLSLEQTIRITGSSVLQLMKSTQERAKTRQALQRAEAAELSVRAPRLSVDILVQLE